jgi:predicted phosphoadenosine phosphosulfate sulfurtransferase
MTGKDQVGITQMLAQNYAERDPAAAASWLVSLPSEVAISDATASILTRWLPRDPEGVAHWVDSVPPSARRDEVVAQFIESAVKTRSNGAEPWVEQIADPALRQKAAESVFWTIEDRAAAREWMRSLKGVDPARQARFLRTW